MAAPSIMANCCCTFITITPKVPGKAESLGKMLTTWKDTKYSNDVAYAASHKNFALFAGLDHSDFDCRGHVDSVCYDSEFINLVNEDDWTPKLVLWFAICNRILGVDQFGFTYSADECGCGLFETNDPGLIGTYYWDNYSDDSRINMLIGDDYYSVTEEDTRKNLLRLLPMMSVKTPTTELLNAFENSEYGELCIIKAWREADYPELKKEA